MIIKQVNDRLNIRYRDEYVGGEWVDALGSSAPDLVNVTIGGVATRKQAYDGNSTEEKKSNTFEIAHDLPIEKINNGTLKIEWHVHGSASNNAVGDVEFFFDWCYKPVNKAPIPMASLSCIISISANQQYFHKVSGAELPVPVGGFSVGGMIEFTLRRTPNGANDTYGADFLFDKTALHVPTNDIGSNNRYYD